MHLYCEHKYISCLQAIGTYILEYTTLIRAIFQKHKYISCLLFHILDLSTIKLLVIYKFESECANNAYNIISIMNLNGLAI